MQNTALATLLIVEDEVEGEVRPAGPPRVRRPIGIPNEIARMAGHRGRAAVMPMSFSRWHRGGTLYALKFFDEELDEHVALGPIVSLAERRELIDGVSFRPAPDPGGLFGRARTLRL